MVMLSALQFSLLHFFYHPHRTYNEIRQIKSHAKLTKQYKMTIARNETRSLILSAFIKLKTISMLEIINNNENAPTQSL